MKIVINSCFGGFGVSPKATLRYNELKGRPCFIFWQPNFHGPMVQYTLGEPLLHGLFYAFDTTNIPQPIPDGWWSTHNVGVDSDHRAEPELVQTIEELGNAANGTYAKLRIVEIPDGITYIIDNYDGVETVHEEHRSWS